MKYFLSINETEISNVSELTISEAYRNETTTYSLAGNMTVERIGKRILNVTAKVNALTQTEMDVLTNAVQLATETVCKFYRGDTLIAKKMRISPFTEPSPLYFYGDREKGYIYGSVELEMEEV